MASVLFCSNLFSSVVYFRSNSGHAPLSGRRASIGCNNGSAFRRVNKSPNVQSSSLVRVDYLAEVHQDGLNVGDYLIEV